MKREHGAAILTAMLTVTLVAALSATALWQQWRGIEIETAERDRLQAAWILQGALDWARLILREDARSGNTDHLAEPWAVPLQEARLSTFLSASEAQGAGDPALDETFLAGRMVDLQGRLNVMNLVREGKPDKPSVAAFARLFDTLHLAPQELELLVSGLLAATTAPAEKVKGESSTHPQSRPLLPRRVGQLVWLGFPRPAYRHCSRLYRYCPSTRR